MNPNCTSDPTLCWKEGVSVLLWLADLDSNGCNDAAHRLVGADDGFHSADGLSLGQHGHIVLLGATFHKKEEH